MDFGMALIALKRGECVARKGWNGKGMFLTLQHGSEVNGNNMRNDGAKNYYGNNTVKISLGNHYLLNDNKVFAKTNHVLNKLFQL